MSTRTWSASDGSMQVVVSLHRVEEPTDAEWSEYLEALSNAMIALKGDSRGIRGLSVSDGGGPNAKQRERLNNFMRRYTDGHGTVAIVTANYIVRAIIKALSLFNPQARSFSPEELPAAIDYLGLSVEQRAEFEFTLNQALLSFPLTTVRAKRYRMRSDAPR
jgi:hypothetical protein